MIIEFTRSHRFVLLMVYLAIMLMHASSVAGAKDNSRNRIDDAIAAILNTYAAKSESGYRVFMRPTLPPESPPTAPIPEYSEAGYLVVVFNRNVPMEEMINEAVSTIPIMLLVSDESELQSALEMLRKNDLGRHLSSGWISVMLQEVDTPWIRDYGPIYVRLSDGSTAAMDAIYNPRRPALESSGLVAVSLLVRAPDERGQDELLPYFLGAELGTPTYRPPIVVSGGNFAADGCKTCFTSTETIEDNGGNRNLTDLIFKTYYGCDEVVYLEPLPGTQTTKHIDMFFRIADDSTYLLGSYERIQSPRTAAQYLQSEARKRMDRNLKILEDLGRRQKRKIRIFRVPMPDLTGPVAVSDSLAYGDDSISTRFWDLLFGSYDDESETGVGGWETGLEYAYRTYLNYIHLKSPAGELVLLPIYPADDDVLRLAIMNDAESQLQKVYPAARIRKIPCDELIQGAGALHCVSLVVPEEVARRYKERVVLRGASGTETSEIPAVAEFDDGTIVPIYSAVQEAGWLAEYYRLHADTSRWEDYRMDAIWDLAVDKVIRREAVKRALSHYKRVAEEISQTDVIRLAQQLGGQYWDQGRLNDYFKLLARDSLECEALTNYLIRQEGKWPGPVDDQEARDYYDNNIDQYTDRGFARLIIVQYNQESRYHSDDYWDLDSGSAESRLSSQATTNRSKSVSAADATEQFLRMIEAADCDRDDAGAITVTSVPGWESEIKILDTTDYWLYELNEDSYWWNSEWIKPGELLRIEDNGYSVLLRVCERVAWSTIPFQNIKDQIKSDLRSSRIREARRAVSDRLNRDITRYETARPAAVAKDM